MGLEKCTGYVHEKNIKARMTNKFLGYKEIKKTTKFNIKNNSIDIELEITKKDWLKNNEILCSKYPELYKV